MSLRTFAAFAGIGCVALLLLAAASRSRRAPGPQSLEEVARAADALGLHQRSDIRSGELLCRLVIADRPLNWEQANRLHFGDAAHPCWHGTVAVCIPWRGIEQYCVPDRGVFCGEVFLYGDSALIQKLAAACGSRDCLWPAPTGSD